MDIWEIAAEKMRKASEIEKGEDNRTILIVGHQKSGKSSMIYRFLGREENPKPSFVLEYMYGRQSKVNDVHKKSVCHVWELGGGTLFRDLVQIPINHNNICDLSVVLTIDLSVPEELLFTLTSLLEAIRKRISICCAQNKSVKDRLTKRFWKKFGSEHPDKGAIDPMLVPLVIVGGKYDIFEDMEPEQRKIICRTLRMIAHTNGAGLLFFSSRKENLVNRVKEVLGHMAFNASISTSSCVDHNKPLWIASGSDSLAQIGGENSSSLTMCKTVYETHFPQISKALVMPEDPAKDVNFREPEIDDLRQQKDDELETYKKELMMTS